jgi:hypothetical protein
MKTKRQLAIMRIADAQAIDCIAHIIAHDDDGATERVQYLMGMSDVLYCTRFDTRMCYVIENALNILAEMQNDVRESNY